MKNKMMKSLALVTLISAVSPQVFSAESLVMSNARALGGSARRIIAQFEVSNPAAECYANVFNNNWPQEYLAEAPITPTNNGYTRTAEADIPEFGFAMEKLVDISCFSSSGNRNLGLKIAAPPAIRLLSNLSKQASGQFVFNANTYIDNHEPYGSCQNFYTPADFNILQTAGQGAPTPQFFANYFNMTKSYSSVNNASLVLVCRNRGGISTVNQIWELQNGLPVKTVDTREYY
jgi:hypothetical protein